MHHFNAYQSLPARVTGMYFGVFSPNVHIQNSPFFKTQLNLHLPNSDDKKVLLSSSIILLFSWIHDMWHRGTLSYVYTNIYMYITIIHPHIELIT